MAAGVISVAAGIFALNGLAGTGAAKFVALLSPAAKTTAWTCAALGLAIDIFVALCWGGKIHIRPMYLG
jgi:hypothetical protein